MHPPLSEVNGWLLIFDQSYLSPPGKVKGLWSLLNNCLLAQQPPMLRTRSLSLKHYSNITETDIRPSML
jgi:hypothetical protein